MSLCQQPRPLLYGRRFVRVLDFAVLGHVGRLWRELAAVRVVTEDWSFTVALNSECVVVVAGMLIL
jgi:hypothetical protein